MSYNIFFISDMHFGHANMCKFLNHDGTRVRPFDDWQECDELMVQNWNEIIKPSDKVYCLGDVSMHKNIADQIMPRLNGKKCLIRGNHDTFVLKWYALWFYDVRGCYNFESYLMTHVPIHPDSKARFKMNIHGHLHSGYVFKRNEDGTIVKDPWYRNVCVDANNYKPIPYEQIQHEFSVYKQRGEIIVPPKMSKEEREGIYNGDRILLS